MNINRFAGMICNLLSGLFFLFAVLFIIQKKAQFQPEIIILFLFLSSISIGIHGLGHYFGNDFTVLFQKEKYKNNLKE